MQLYSLELRVSGAVPHLQYNQDKVIFILLLTSLYRTTCQLPGNSPRTLSSHLSESGSLMSPHISVEDIVALVLTEARSCLQMPKVRTRSL